MSESRSSGGGCFTETLALLVFIWLLLNMDPTLAMLQRMLETAFR